MINEIMQERLAIITSRGRFRDCGRGASAPLASWFMTSHFRHNSNIFSVAYNCIIYENLPLLNCKNNTEGTWVEWSPSTL